MPGSHIEAILYDSDTEHTGRHKKPVALGDCLGMRKDTGQESHSNKTGGGETRELRLMVSAGL